MPITPKDDRDLKQIIEDMLRRLKNLENANPLQVGATITNGGLTIKGGGGISVYSAAGELVFFVGKVPIPDGSGRTQIEIGFARDDGSAALILADLGTTPGHTHQQALQWYDRSHNVVFADDTISGQGLANPYIPIGQWADYGTVPTATTTSPTFTNLQTLVGVHQHPKVSGQILVYSDSGTTGVIQMVDGSGNVIMSTTLASGTFGFVNFGPVVMPGINGTGISLILQGKVTGGAGKVGVRGISALGVQS